MTCSRHTPHSSHGAQHAPYNTQHTQLFLEAPFTWGSDLSVTLTATLRLPLLGTVVTLPLPLRRLQLSAHARLTARPLLEEYPFAGACVCVCCVCARKLCLQHVACLLYSDIGRKTKQHTAYNTLICTQNTRR